MTNDTPRPAPTGASVVRALLFDLDGTLIDTEVHTDTAIRVIAERHGATRFALPPVETRGRTWGHIASTMKSMTGIDAPLAVLEAQLLECWNAAVVDVKPVPGSPAAIRAAATARLKIAVVSSSPRSVINHFIDKLGVTDCIDAGARIGADSVTRGKPDPEGFLSAARVLGVPAAECLVFEDSSAGLHAARGAGMRSMFITCCATDVDANATLATARTTDYRALPPTFWRDIASGTIDLTGRSFG